MISVIYQPSVWSIYLEYVRVMMLSLCRKDQQMTYMAGPSTRHQIFHTHTKMEIAPLALFQSNGTKASATI